MELVRTLEDGATVVTDPADGYEAVLKPGQWEEIEALPEEEQRAATEAAVTANMTSGEDPRSELDQQAMETAQNASSGEAHEQ